MSNIPTASDEAPDIAGSLPRCEFALELLLTHRGTPSAEVDRVLADDPGCVFGHCMRAALIVLADNAAARPTLAASLTAIESASADTDERARCHAGAARAWLEGDSVLAAERYGGIVTDWSRDILALVVAHALDFRLGQRRMLRDRIAQVLPAWDAAATGYASVLAMYAFGLEENGEYGRAEKVARRALALDPRHPAAIHVISHVMEMQGRTREGLAFLAATEPAWGEGTGFSVHLAWHRALFHLDAVDPHSALAVYDAQIAKPGASDMNVLADASALLWRLQLRSVDVGTRWRHLADRWEMHSFTGARPFYTVHAMMAFAAAGRTDAAARVFDACRISTPMARCRRCPRKRLRHRSAKRCSPSRGVTTPRVLNGWNRCATSQIAAAAASPSATSSISRSRRRHSARVKSVSLTRLLLNAQH